MEQDAYEQTVLQARRRADEREALLRLAAGTGSLEDVRFLAAQLNHRDLFNDCAEQSTLFEDDPE